MDFQTVTISVTKSIVNVNFNKKTDIKNICTHKNGFKCKTGDQNICFDLVCNSENDCNDNSDELSCGNFYLKKDTLNYIKFIKINQKESGIVEYEWIQNLINNTVFVWVKIIDM